ncbi:hypothetical protein M2132_001288 [Dysgonomonas sp. PH5-45]|uniref:hypothetical protein n=1 Tax=unclassified Dysgonomonas TaxID=2630389 RepID=UPI00247551EA|nr:MULTISPECIES: hypothetical protein [unclassified Dysgonomonas]MDH6354953.1 hypothetical protein [Dysgonomonas sp. PH5-45]MDH6387852.1 hypothetical protein [Dysgonomonas sp. PH5-37]
MKNIKLLTLGLIAALFLFAACDGDDDNDNNGRIEGYVPEEIIVNFSDGRDYNTTTQYNFEYDEQNRITQIIENHSWGGWRYIFSYKENGQMEKYIINLFNNNGTSGGTMECPVTYEGQIVKFRTKDSGPKEKTIKIDSHGRAVSGTMLLDYSSYIEAFSFKYDKAGRLSKAHNRQGAFYFKYDSHPGIWQNVNMPKWFFANFINVSQTIIGLYVVDLHNKTMLNWQNNLTEITWNNEYDYRYYTSINYTYNTNGYPSTAEWGGESNKYEVSIRYKQN